MGGHALADVIFGRISPAGRTTQTWYESDEAMPSQGLMRMRPTESNGSSGWTYRYHNKQPAIPFGFGLSFTRFSYSELRLNLSAAAGANPCATIGLQVKVTNVGGIDSDEVVQCYIKQPNATTAPKVRLADFARVHIRAGQSVTVDLSFGPKEQALVIGDAGVYHPIMVVPAGTLEVHVGGGQPDFYSGSLMSTVQISKAANLTRLYECDAY
jgi:beta-glucosidase